MKWDNWGPHGSQFEYMDTSLSQVSLPGLAFWVLGQGQDYLDNMWRTLLSGEEELLHTQKISYECLLRKMMLNYV